MQNVEFKAELRDPQLARILCARLGAVRVCSLRQRDTYFRMADGKLKRRETEGEEPEWIFYHRAHRLRPKLSHFAIYSEEEARAKWGAADPPTWVVVQKARELWMWKNVRLHLDEVEGLGWFFEAEALVSKREHVGRCQRRVAKVREKLAPALGGLIATGYAEMLAAEREADVA